MPRRMHREADATSGELKLHASPFSIDHWARRRSAVGQHVVAEVLYLLAAARCRMDMAPGEAQLFTTRAKLLRIISPLAQLQLYMAYGSPALSVR